MYKTPVWHACGTLYTSRAVQTIFRISLDQKQTDGTFYWMKKQGQVDEVTYPGLLSKWLAKPGSLSNQYL